eukprot:TRINITY_DN16310_c0_g2_i2.p1 TRINITY_DN16310_c0_g2~~TRINITY_DN16310_c0_g2_i2.p1  ORF type:complete len:366 (+),score=29.29 TRINITY_DN16310_c0_g2_i2:50-1147(+)
MKRAAPTSSVEAPAKKANVAGPPEGQGEQWTCTECQNVNWPLRTNCNRCKALGPWTCPACDNKNFQGRTECNRKSCRQPRPGSMPAAMSSMGSWSGATDPPGSWSCKGCQNMNWPLRTKCKKCDMPRDEGDQHYHAFCAASGQNPSGSWICAGCENVNWPLRTSCKKCNASREVADGGSPPVNSNNSAQAFSGRSSGPAAMLARSFNSNAGGGQNPPGSWLCTGCENVNWPMRTSCKKCHANKELVDGGAPPQSGHAHPYQALERAFESFAGPSGILAASSLNFNAGGGGNPPGSWTCNSCTNVNWPMRTQCKKCSAPKPGGGATSSPKGGRAAPEGSWTCAVCANVNWPLRTICNNTACRTPKP